MTPDLTLRLIRALAGGDEVGEMLLDAGLVSVNELDDHARVEAALQRAVERLIQS